MPTPRDQGSPLPKGEPTFDTTRWSVVLLAGRAPNSQSAAALQTLCQTYWYPLYAYVRRRATDVSQAQDLTQAFFAELVEKNFVGIATPERGRFRAFLLTALKHFLSKQWERANAQKRGGGRAPLSLDFQNADSRYASEPALDLTPEQIYDRNWAVTLLAEVMQRLEKEFNEYGQAEQFRLIKGFAIGDHAGTTYAEVAAALRTTEAAAKMAAHRMRQRYRQLLRDEIAQTVATPAEVDDEIRSLFNVLKS